MMNIEGFFSITTILYMHPDIAYINNQESDTGWGGPLVEYVWSFFPLLGITFFAI
jgi:hypothetical protein